MKSNIFLLATCDLGPLQFLLWGLFPFLMGLLLGWLLWARFKRRVDELESEVSRLTKLNRDADAKLSAWNTKYDDLLVLNTGLKSDLSGWNTKYDDMIAKNKRLEADLSGWNTKYDDLIAKNKKLEADLSGWNTKYDDLIAKNKRLEADLTACNGRNKDLESKLAKASLTSSDTVASIVPPVSKTSLPKSDNLKKIEGVGPKTNDLLNKAGIHTYSDLADVNMDQLRNIFIEAGPNYQLIDPDSWPTQARLARDGKWDELEEYQDYLIGGVDPAKMATKNTDSDLDLDAAKSVFGKKIDLNDLTIIEGIGPKIASVLDGADIKTWRKLAATPVEQLNTILEKNELQFHNPKTWPRQAAMAASGLWKELLNWQDILDGGKE